jgi:hypothetical protein
MNVSIKSLFILSSGFRFESERDKTKPFLFHYVWFNNDVSRSEYIAPSGRMIVHNESERM